jgi:hypothetical protein
MRRPRFDELAYLPSLALGLLGVVMIRAARRLLVTVDDARTVD